MHWSFVQSGVGMLTQLSRVRCCAFAGSLVRVQSGEKKVDDDYHVLCARQAGEGPLTNRNRGQILVFWAVGFDSVGMVIGRVHEGGSLKERVGL